MGAIDLARAAVLGIVEGLTEFLPVSSTGHLIVVQQWLGLSGRKQNAFSIVIQLGAVLAVVWLYRGKFLELLRGWRSDPRASRLFLNLVAGTLPAIVIGLPTDDWIEAHLFTPVAVATAFIVGGLLILAIERRRTAPSVSDVDDVGVRKALGVGLFQVLAILFPGVSRAGATIMGGMMLGLSRRAATEFSFFLAIPALLGASLVKLYGVRHLVTAGDAPFFAVGFITSFVVALLVIGQLLRYVSRHSFVPFAWYRIAAGGLLLAAALLGGGAFHFAP